MNRARAESPRDGAPRIAIYTHDTYGLGHVRRCLRIATAAARRDPAASILIVSGTPAVHVFDALPPNVDLLKLPTVVKTGPEADRPSHLRLPVPEMTVLRARVTAAALDAFRPDVLLVDNFPLGSCRELEPSLASQAARGAPSVLGLRDIVDHPDVVRRTWTKEGLYDVAERHYARLLVYGRPEVFDVGDAYGFPAGVRDRLRYCGYVTDAGATIRSAHHGAGAPGPTGRPERPPRDDRDGRDHHGVGDGPAVTATFRPGAGDEDDQARAERGAPSSEAIEAWRRERAAEALARRFDLVGPVLVATAGGGGDGLPLLSAVVDALWHLRQVGAVLVTGPLMSARARGELFRKIEPLPGVRIVRHLRDLPQVMDVADVLVTMGGYNTLAELARRGRRAIVVPRDWRYGEQQRREGIAPEWEQRLRAEAFERLGLARVVMPESLTPESLARAVEAELDAPTHVAPPWPPDTTPGAERVADELFALAGRPKRPAAAGRAAARPARDGRRPAPRTDRQRPDVDPETHHAR